MKSVRKGYKTTLFVLTCITAVSLIVTLAGIIMMFSIYVDPTSALPEPRAVDAIDSIAITEWNDPDAVLAEWKAVDNSIQSYEEFTSAMHVRLQINWSDAKYPEGLHEGDYFTFVIPDIFVHNWITNETNEEITDDAGNIVATYSIYENSQGRKEIKLTFTDYVEDHTDISGDLWCFLYIGSVDTTEEKDLEFIINGDLAASGNVTVTPEEEHDYYRPNEYLKYGQSLPEYSEYIIDGYYIFTWTVHLNMGENSDKLGFNTIDNYSFEDIIPPDSPHVFITSEIASELNIPSEYRSITIDEYIGSDLDPPASRYLTFLKRYNYIDGDYWFDYLRSNTLTNGITSPGIDGKNGLNISNVKITDKSVSANLGTLTRPTLIQYYTIATIKLSESALGDPETVKFFKNTFTGTAGWELDKHLNLYYFGSGGHAEGILGDYSFKFTKVDGSGNPLPGAMFSLFKNENLTGGADRFIFSDENGIVTFEHIAKGTYYFQETIPPEGYLPNNNVYKVVITSNNYVIYYGNNFENKLSDLGNKIVNVKKDVESVSVSLTGKKTLTGKDLNAGMFTFAVKDADGNTVVTGVNDEYGNIVFDEIIFTSAGTYTYTITEVDGNETGYAYDQTEYSVTVIVTQNADGTLSPTVEYPDGGILFRNIYVPVGNVSLIKYNSDKTEKLFGAEFELYRNDETLFGVYETDEEGMIIVEELNYGKYYFVESKAPDGYMLDTTKIHFDINDETTQSGTVNVMLEVINKEISAIFSFKKVDAESSEPLEGAQFDLYLWDGEGEAPEDLADLGWRLIDTRTSAAETGLVYFEDLLPGEYQLVETKAPDGYKLPMGQWRFAVNPDGIITILPGIGDDLPPAFLEDDTVENPYLLKNEKIKATFSFYKVNLADQNEFLPGALFKLYLWEGEGDAPAELVPKDLVGSGWTFIDISISKESGLVMFEGLRPGTYQIEEARAPNGYKLPIGQWRFTVNPDGTITILPDIGDDLPPAFQEDGTIENPYLLRNEKEIKATFSFYKVNLADKNEFLSGALFKLYLWEGEGDAPAELIPKDLAGSGWTFIDSISSNDSGLVMFEDLRPGTYQIEEVKTPNGYKLPMGQWRFTVNPDGTITILPSIGGDTPPAFHEDGTIENPYLLSNEKEIKATFSFYKVNFSDLNEFLTGAQFKLYLWGGTSDAPAELVPKDPTESSWTFIDMITSDKESGLVVFENLRPGIYQMVETKQPTGHQLPMGQWRFTVNDDGTISILSSIGDYKPPAIKENDMDDVQYLIGNVAQFRIPEMGGGGIIWYLLIGILLLANGVLLSAIYIASQGNKTRKSSL